MLMGILYTTQTGEVMDKMEVLTQVKDLGSCYKTYGAGTKYDKVTGLFNDSCWFKLLLEGRYGKTVERLVDIINEAEDKLPSDKLSNCFMSFTAESMEEALDDNELRRKLKENYDLTSDIIRLITLCMAITLDAKRPHFDFDRHTTKYTKQFGIKSFPKLEDSESAAFRIIIQIGRYTLLDILQLDFCDDTSWPFSDNLIELMLSKIDNYIITENIVNKMKMTGVKQYKGMNIKQAVYMLLLRDLLKSRE